MGWITGSKRPARPLEVTIDGFTYKGWVSGIFRAYLQRSSVDNRLLPQGWEDKVWRALHAKYPSYIINEGPKEAPPQVSISTIKSFLSMVRRRGLAREVVSEDVARARAAICSECPKAGVITGCSACKSLVKSILKTPKTNFVPHDKSGCTVCGCFVDAKVWIKDEHLVDELSNHDWWEDCWMRTLDSAIR